jgi:hypothetical protein
MFALPASGEGGERRWSFSDVSSEIALGRRPLPYPLRGAERASVQRGCGRHERTHHPLRGWEPSPPYFFRAATSLVIDANIAGNDAETMALLILRSTNPGRGALTSRAAV